MNTPEALTAASVVTQAAYVAASTAITTDITTFKTNQISSVTALGAVSGLDSAAAALAASNVILKNSEDLIKAAILARESANASMDAALRTVDTADDVIAASAQVQSIVNLATAENNVELAKKSVAAAIMITGIYSGNMYTFTTPADAITAVLAAVNSNLTTTIILNSNSVAGAIAVADNYFTSKSNIQNLVIQNSGSGAQEYALGALYAASGITNIYISDLSGAIALNDTATGISSTLSVNTLSGALAVTTGSMNDTINLNSLSGAIAVLGGDGNNVITGTSQSGVVSVTLGNGINDITAVSTGASGAINIILGSGTNTIHANAGGGAITMTMTSGTENIEAHTLAGAINITQMAGTGTAVIDTSTGASGATTIVVADGANTISAASAGGAITITTGNGPNTISTQSVGGLTLITTGTGEDHITVSSGASGATINAGGGNNFITLGFHSTLIDIINTTTANSTIVTGAHIGATLADKFIIGSIGSTTLASTAETAIAGTSSVLINTAGILEFDHLPTSTGITFAAEVLTFLKATPTTYGKVVSYDDGANQWLFVASNSGAGQYVELHGSHSASFAGASTTPAANTIFIGA